MLLNALPLLAIIALVVFLFSRQGRQGANRFHALGDIRGMPMASIIKKVGPPNSISASGDGQLYQWISAKGRRGFHYAIIADSDDNAVGYTHQFVH